MRTRKHYENRIHKLNTKNPTTNYNIVRKLKRKIRQLENNS